LIYSLLTFFFSLSLFSLFFAGLGKLLIKIISPNNKSFLEEILYGIYFCSFITLVFNFIFKIDWIYSYFLFFIGFFYFLINYKKKSKVLKLIFLITLFSSILIFYSKFQEDFPWYSLPYISILNENKIIFGLTNIQFRFGVTSILTYGAAFAANIIKVENLIIPYILSSVVILIYFFNEALNKKNLIELKLYSFFISGYMLVKFTRFEEYGNDVPAQFLFFYVIYKLYNLNLKKNFPEKICLTILIISIIFQKLTMLPIVLIFILFLKGSNIKSLTYLIIISILMISTWTIKNLATSGCFVYPVDTTCIKSLSWTANKETHGDAKRVSLESEAWTKAWIDQNSDNILKYDEYVENFDWIKVWYKKNLNLIFEKLLPLILLFLISIVYSQKNKTKKDENFLQVQNYLILVCIISIFVWFFNYPIYRYGSGFFVVLIISTFIRYFYKNNLIINLKYVRYTLCICLVFFIIKNVYRIKDNYTFQSNSLFPRVFLDNENYEKNYTIAAQLNGIKVIYPSNNKACHYSGNFCTHHLETIQNLNIKYKNGFIFFSSK